MTNGGSQAFSIGRVVLTGTGAANYAIENDTCSGTDLGASLACAVDVVFCPTSAGDKGATMDIPSPSTSVITTVDLDGNGSTGVMLEIAKSGSGSGIVTSLPAGIRCGAVCYASFDRGTAVRLKALADTGSIFTGWSQPGLAGLSFSKTQKTIMTADRTLAATFSSASIFAVLSPDAGEAWKQGSRRVISWVDPPGRVDRERVDIYKGDEPCKGLRPWIRPFFPGMRSISWRVPAHLPPGEDYSVRVTRIRGSQRKSASSPSFAIVAR